LVIEDPRFYVSPLFLVPFVGFAVTVFILFRLIGTRDWKVTLSSFSIAACIILCALTVSIALRASFDYRFNEDPTELLLYAQTGQETTRITDCINLAVTDGYDDLGASDIVVDNTNNFSWQWRWYLRDYPGVRYLNLQTEDIGTILEADLVLISENTEIGSAPMLDRFVRVGTTNYLWWFPKEAYADLTISQIASGVLSRDSWDKAITYFLWRDLDRDMYFSRGAVYSSEKYSDYLHECIGSA
jgi:hypothetical protein